MSEGIASNLFFLFARDNLNRKCEGRTAGSIKVLTAQLEQVHVQALVELSADCWSLAELFSAH